MTRGRQNTVENGGLARSTTGGTLLKCDAADSNYAFAFRLLVPQSYANSFAGSPLPPEFTESGEGPGPSPSVLSKQKELSVSFRLLRIPRSVRNLKLRVVAKGEMRTAIGVAGLIGLLALVIRLPKGLRSGPPFSRGWRGQFKRIRKSHHGK